MSNVENKTLKKYTVLFQSIKQLAEFQQAVKPVGYLMVPQVNLISAKFSDKEIEIAVGTYGGEIKPNMDINTFVHE